MNESKKRTRVACETCRRKKIKCSGESPCLNCIQSKEAMNCKYAEKIHKPQTAKVKANKRFSNAKAIKIMEDRMSRLEGFIFNISDKLDNYHQGKSGSDTDDARGYGGGSRDAKSISNNMSSATDSDRNGDDDEEAEDEEDEDGEEDEETDDEHGTETADDGQTLQQPSEDEQSKYKRHKRGNVTDDSKTSSGKRYSIKPSLNSSNMQLPSVVSVVGGRKDSGLDDDFANTLKESGESSTHSFGNSDEVVKDVFLYTLREQFFDSHSFLSICSQKSMEWMKKSLAPERVHVLNQFNRFPFFFFSRSKRMLSKWVQPTIITPKNYQRVLTKPLMADSEYIRTLLECFLLSLPHIGLLVSFEKLFELLDSYYKDKRLNSSQLLILIGAVHISISAKLGQTSFSAQREGTEDTNYPEVQLSDRAKEVLGRVSDYDLNKFQDNLIDSAVAHYQRVSVISQGIETIRGILLLCIALEAGGLPDIDYMMVSVAVRYAQELGLHRPESYFKLSTKEAMERRCLWCVCQRVDIEFSFRNGKPPVLSTNDIARSSAQDLSVAFDVSDLGDMAQGLQADITFNPDLQTYHISPEAMECAYQNKCYMFIIFYFDYLLSRVRSKSYYKLFSSVGNLQSVENLENILEGLNNDILNISNSICQPFRPQFYDEPGFMDSVDMLEVDMKDHLIEAYCVFFFHLTLTNRVPFMIETSIDSEKISTFRKIHVRSARTLLHILLKLNLEELKTFSLNWISFYVFAAFLMLSSNCMNNPAHPETVEDIELLRDVSNKFFELKNNKQRHIRLRYMQRSNFAAIIMKLFVELAIAIVESQTNTKIAPDTIHQRHLLELRTAAPELFTSKAVEFELHIKSSLDHRENLSNSTSIGGSTVNSAEGRSFQNSPNTDPAAHSLLNTNGSDGINNGYYQSSSPSNNPSLANIINRNGNGNTNQTRTSPQMISQLDDIPLSAQHTGFTPQNGTPLNPNRMDQRSRPGSSSSTQQSPDFLGIEDFVGGDSLGNMVNYQINQLPNFFFDNNLGF